jgi:hypothetical protein
LGCNAEQRFRIRGELTDRLRSPSFTTRFRVVATTQRWLDVVMTETPGDATPDATAHDDASGGAGADVERGGAGVDAARTAVVGPDGQPVIVVVAEPDRGEAEGSVADLVERPAKVMRIGSMIKQLLDEVRTAPLDDASRTRLLEIHRRSIKELEDGLAPELVDELERLSLPFTEDHVPSDAELRIAQAQLVGWLEGLFHGIQAALFAQQVAAQAQLEQAQRRALGAGSSSDPSQAPPPQQGGNGLYL